MYACLCVPASVHYVSSFVHVHGYTCMGVFTLANIQLCKLNLLIKNRKS